MTLDPETDAHEPHHSASSTTHVLTELQLYGCRPLEDEPDPRPLPEADRIAGAVTGILDALVATLRRPNSRSVKALPLSVSTRVIFIGAVRAKSRRNLRIYPAQ